VHLMYTITYMITTMVRCPTTSGLRVGLFHGSPPFLLDSRGTDCLTDLLSVSAVCRLNVHLLHVKYTKRLVLTPPPAVCLDRPCAGCACCGIAGRQPAAAGGCGGAPGDTLIVHL
jgi:hypothetical protein